jgi:hypothetical protein
MSESQASKEELFWFGYDNVKAKPDLTLASLATLAAYESQTKEFHPGCFAPRLRIVA